MVHEVEMDGGPIGHKVIDRGLWKQSNIEN